MTVGGQGIEGRQIEREKEKHGEQRGLLKEGNYGDKTEAKMGGEKNKNKKAKT